MYITLDALRNMAKPRRTPSSSSVAAAKDVIECERPCQLNIEKNNRRLQEPGIPMITSLMRTIQKVYDEDAEYSPTEEEKMQVEFDDVPLAHQRSTMQRPPFGREVALIRSRNGHNTQRMSSRILF